MLVHKDPSDCCQSGVVCTGECSGAVAALVGLIAPLPYSADFRPYLTIHDATFSDLLSHPVADNGNSLPRLLGITNLYFLKVGITNLYFLKVGITNLYFLKVGITNLYFLKVGLLSSSPLACSMKLQWLSSNGISPGAGSSLRRVHLLPVHQLYSPLQRSWSSLWHHMIPTNWLTIWLQRVTSESDSILA